MWRRSCPCVCLRLPCPAPRAVLYILDLRELQDAVNDILVTVQEFTANPRTDAALGQVGR